MKCHQFRDLMDDYLDNEILSDLKQEFDQHSTACADCQVQLKQRKSLVSMLTDAAHDNWSIDLVADVMETITRQPLPAQKSPMRIPLIIAASCALIASIAIFYLGVAGFPAGISVWEVTQSLTQIIQVPDGLQDTIVEIKAFGDGCWMAVRALVFFGFKIIRFMARLTPFLMIPFLILAFSIVGYLWITRNRSRRSYISSRQ